MKQEKLLLPTEQTLSEFTRIFISRLKTFVKTVVISGLILFFVAIIFTIIKNNTTSSPANLTPSNSTTSFIELFFQTDKYLAYLISNYGTWTYTFLFLVVILSTGLFLTPFLPINSVIFGAGLYAALGSLNFWLLCFIVTIASIFGNTINYWIGHYLGERAYNTGWIKKEYLNKSHAFFEKHGGKTIFLARFIPVVRTIAPFVAGISRMSYGYFTTYNITSGIVWVISLLSTGYIFGNISFVKQNLELLIVATIVLSISPTVISWQRLRRKELEKERKTAG